MKNILKRVLSVATAAVLTLSLAACGSADGNGSGQWQPPEWVYVPEYMELSDDISYWSMQPVGEYLYYETSYNDEETGEWKQGVGRYSLADQSKENIALDIGDASINSMAVAEDGSVCALLYYWESDELTGEFDSWQALTKYDSTGAQVWQTNLKSVMEDNNISYVSEMTADAQGRVYLTSESQVLLFDETGAFRGIVDVGSGVNSWIQNMGKGKDGKVYVMAYSYNGTSSSYTLSEIDFEKKAVGASYENFPSGNGSGSLSTGVEYDFLVMDNNALYGYNLADQNTELLFRWMDSDINGEYVRTVGVAPDGRIFAVINDWNTNESSVALLTKTASSEVAERETILIGTLYSSSELTAAAVRFNKSNDKYRVYIKEYIDRQADWTETTYSDAIALLNNDITSRNAPDAIALDSLEIKQLVAAGALEDISGYLDKSSVLNREDYLENVLAGYTFGDVLVGIPKTFTLQTVVGSTADVGEEMGWSLDDIIAYADRHPNANLFDYMTKSGIMYNFMMYNESAFVDWEKGECHFNSPEFISLLNFVNRFQEEPDYDSNISTATRIQNGEVLLDTVYVSDFREVQMYNAIYKGAATFIGYPTTDGSVGCALSADNILGITTKSSNKDGAWAFIESYLAAEDSDRFSWGFSSNKERLNAQLEEAIKVRTYTWTDEDGVEHEEVMEGGSSVGYQDGWSYTYHTPTREEADQIMELIKVASPAAAQNGQIMLIISEEAEAFYKGQKSAEEVADVIQRRAQTYVDENS
ncbi:MAG: extracellular solute-binding protein [bacterium]|nr:extracellular solute-binding protein [bacterium]